MWVGSLVCYSALGSSIIQGILDSVSARPSPSHRRPHVMELLNVFANRLAELIQRELFLCRGMLRISIMDLEKNIGAMTFQDWKEVLEGPVAQRLAAITIANA